MEHVKAWLKKSGLAIEYGYRKETRLIPRALRADEAFAGMTSGVCKGRRWAIVLSDRRLLLLSRPTLGEPDVIAFEHAAIRSIIGHKGLLFAHLDVHTDSGPLAVTNVLKKSLPVFMAAAEKAGIETR